MQRQAAEEQHSAPHKKRAKMPWIISLLLLPAKGARALARGLWHLARKNVPLALGVALFAGVFAAMGYNALFRQAGMARPVLFSTRAGLAAGQKRPFVEKAISTEGLAAGRAAADARPKREPRAAKPAAAGGNGGLAHDMIADFLDKQAQPARGKTAAPARESAPAAVPSAKPRLPAP